MRVDPDEVRRIADLARLGIDDVEVDRLTDEMNRILEYANRLRGVEVEPEAPEMSDPHDAGVSIGGGTRSIEVERPDALSDGIASFAPQEADGFFVVPPLPGVSEDRKRGQPEVGG